ncbi:MAG: pantoate--beta-alanine ligase [Phycisphaerae bacterium]|nr:pantoate--beta-alanine ligase [Phycisphaerae bacterium]
METTRTIADVRRVIGTPRAAGRSVGFVPTMGALHAGHAALIDRARAETGCVVVSIFVNPTQFGPGEDYDSYPRCEREDLAVCEAHGADVVFAPSVEEMYPRRSLTTVHVDRLSETLCGADRPGHFDGVCTVVAKLLNIVAPDRAYFGAKDYQQATILRRMVSDLNVPVELVVCPTVREPDGLAVSSRNRYLSAEQRRQAPALHAALQQAAAMIRRDAPPAETVIEAVRAALADGAPDGTIDYVRVVDPETLEDVQRTDRPVVIALAVRLGSARLIDNLRVDPPAGAS